MILKAYIPSLEQTKSFLLKLSLISLGYFIVAYIGVYLSPYINTIKFFELSAIAIAAVLAIRYGWVGVLGSILGSVIYHLLYLPWHITLALALSAGMASFLFSYLFRLFHPPVVVINQVSAVATFAFVVTPIVCAVHTACTALILQHYNLMVWDGVAKGMLMWWFDELLIAYLTVPLLLSLLSYKKVHFSTHEKIEVVAILLGMGAVSWLAMHFSQLLGSSEILILVLLVFVLWASLRFNSTIAQLAIFTATIFALITLVFSDRTPNHELYAQALLMLKIGLVLMIVGGLFVAAAFSERNHVETELNKLANHDPLTGLPNRMYFQDFISRSLAHAQRQKYQVYLLFIDLNRFKKINDSEGHEVGDAVLKIVANRLNDVLRGDDFVARLGGDEFAVVFTHPPVNNAASNLARKVINIISQPFELNARRYSVGASIGISVYPNDTNDANTLLRQADLAMYQAKSKQSGFEYFSEEMNILAHEQLQIENGLRQAIERKELLLMYQPKVDLRTNQVVGLEALVRWVTKTGVMIGPDKFIPIAEDAGLIIPIGRFVIEAACAQWVMWNNEGLNPPPIAVNISPRQFSDPSLIDDIKAAISSTGMESSMLHVEITESATMDDPEMTLKTLEQMHELKLHLYIDDFGTGHSNLGQLRRLPIDAVKIDKSFIDNILSNNDDAEIVTAIINLAHALKLRVVSEGIETKAQLSLLRALGCDEIQGYLISKPLLPDQVMLFFNRTIAL
ncbi:MAG: EAL domain-containing protein [Bdellovibrio sp.]|nr:EAL domain-containing protein [Methylotenera sp.]